MSPAVTRRQWLGGSAGLLAAALPGFTLLPVVAAQAAADDAATPPEVRAAWPDARLRGAGMLRAFGLRIAEVQLWSPQPVDPARYAATPLALVLRYQRSLSGSRIADRSIDEMAGVGALPDGARERWRASMAQLFPDVQEGDRITGLQLPPDTARFSFNGQARGDVREPGFAPLFFGIWLSPRTSEPALRRQLLGPDLP